MAFLVSKEFYFWKSKTAYKGPLNVHYLVINILIKELTLFTAVYSLSLLRVVVQNALCFGSLSAVFDAKRNLSSSHISKVTRLNSLNTANPITFLDDFSCFVIIALNLN
ncbi:hypothetical protein RCL_jg7338.t1 [Rhizophagus clarus]|uniref:Uncharacterized protein n=1 Tax=Rhizophagus clarus TaxID=94130 RepID=A0A8H3QIF8_9GLOM|nr:hypothetical protein RCL_jg7338.t1 [Rhizophagus clarus]